MAESLFNPEQQAALRALLPARADAIQTEYDGERMSGPEWGLRFLDHLAVCHREYVQKGRKNSFSAERDELACFEQRLAELVPPRAIPEAMAQQLHQMRKDVAGLVEIYEDMAKANKYPKNSHRELIYRQILYVWTSLGGKLSVTHDFYKNTTTGSLIPYFEHVASLVLDEPSLSADAIDGIVRREKKRQAGKPPRKRPKK
jgi:hypothetical protein